MKVDEKSCNASLFVLDKKARDGLTLSHLILSNIQDKGQMKKKRDTGFRTLNAEVVEHLACLKKQPVAAKVCSTMSTRMSLSSQRACLAYRQSIGHVMHKQQYAVPCCTLRKMIKFKLEYLCVISRFHHSIKRKQHLYLRETILLENKGY